ncbi:MAG: hypothetical protein C5B51_32350 [Terriglobia bacterium]|nr:MAG: hypothetical protein C5B51_32350 [Terriglobia bacterium]
MLGLRRASSNRESNSLTGRFAAILPMPSTSWFTWTGVRERGSSRRSSPFEGMIRRSTAMTWSESMSASRFDPTIPAIYVRENFEPADRLAVVVLNKRTNSVIQRIATAEAIAEPAFQAWLHHRNEHDRSEIYISMNALHANATGRTKRDIAAIRHIYLDFDTDGTAAVERLLKRGDTPKPNYLINTSPDKWQVIWKVAGFGKDQAENLQRGLARGVGADPAAVDCARVLRLPGFENHKYNGAHTVRAERLGSDRYSPDHFPIFSSEEHIKIEPARLAAGNRVRDSLSQSERDWAYAKRALARGEKPESVAAAIANHRRKDKPDPEYYAELTVRKAQDVLRSQDIGPQRPLR